MNNVTEIVALLRQQSVLETTRALQRTPDAVSVRDVTAFGGSH